MTETAFPGGLGIHLAALVVFGLGMLWLSRLVERSWDRRGTWPTVTLPSNPARAAKLTRVLRLLQRVGLYGVGTLATIALWMEFRLGLRRLLRK